MDESKFLRSCLGFISEIDTAIGLPSEFLFGIKGWFGIMDFSIFVSV